MAQQQRARAVTAHESFLRHAHFRWLKIAIVTSLLVAAGFATTLVARDYHLRHTGNSWFGYVSGMLGARKRYMTDSVWSLKAWVSAHVYLGLSLIVIATLHSGLQFGWNVHTLAYALMMLVILSGIFGITVYALLPRKLSDDRSETTRKQMVEKIHTLDTRLLEVARPLDRAEAALVTRAVQRTRIGGSFWRRLTNAHGNCETLHALNALKVQRQTVGEGKQAQALDKVISLLEEKSLTLEKARRYIYLRSLLEVWLFIHIPATIALIAALAAHIISVFFFW